ncbi:MAG: phosphate ABC transporter substrate-binding protein [Oscillochloridaceae bacterium]|nr:phosphate ABC transporter substrate-binding protein [Chloroflexaceae bacterium]MDW8391367.1 phosphate ABC transporter substrate-binding protein [Oscillochloridaceae bacterium]
MLRKGMPIVLIALVGLSLLPVACGQGGTTGGDGLRGNMTIAGSSALQPLVDQAAQVFQRENAAVRITVSAGGSGAGRANVCKGTIDIGTSDVPLSEEEKQSLNCADAVETVVAVQAFGAAANPQGPGDVKALSREQLVGIFSGKITNWSEVGGTDQRIVVINRAAGSGTRAQMANYLFNGDDSQFATGAAEVDANQTVVNNIRQTPGAISYLGFAFLGDAGIVAFNVLDDAGQVVELSEANIAAGKWPIGGPGFGITKGPPSELEQAFLNFITSAEFANDPIWQNLGFVSPALKAAGSR